MAQDKICEVNRGGDTREGRGGIRGSGRDGDIRGSSRQDGGRAPVRAEGEGRIRSIVSTSAPAATKQSKESKDLLKMAGQKSSIKLTLKVGSMVLKKTGDA